MIYDENLSIEDYTAMLKGEKIRYRSTQRKLSIRIIMLIAFFISSAVIVSCGIIMVVRYNSILLLLNGLVCLITSIIMLCSYELHGKPGAIVSTKYREELLDHRDTIQKLKYIIKKLKLSGGLDLEDTATLEMRWTPMQ